MHTKTKQLLATQTVVHETAIKVAAALVVGLEQPNSADQAVTKPNHNVVFKQQILAAIAILHLRLLSFWGIIVATKDKNQ